MAGFNYTFDASQYAPEQSAGVHPVGKFPAVISNTSLPLINDGEDKDRPQFAVEFETPSGRITSRYSLFSLNPQYVDWANKRLSALCHATGIFKIGMQDTGAVLRGARCMIEVGPQKTKPEYTEVKRVFDPQGNEPGKAPIAQAQTFAAAPAPALKSLG